jgi:hypothetical protein
MKRSNAFPGNYLAKDDVLDPLIVIIDAVNLEPVKCEHGDENKPVMRFQHEQLKPLIVNQVNWQTLEDAHGEDSDGWIGKPVEVYCDPSVMFGGRRVGGVRVRIPVDRPQNKHVAPSVATTPTKRPAAPPIRSVDDDHEKALIGMDNASTRANLDEWAAWGKKLPLTPDQFGEQEDAYHINLERIATANNGRRQRQTA